MRKTILNVPIDWLTMDEAMLKIAQFIVSGKPHQITTVNPEFIVESRKDPEFLACLTSADLSLPDGIGICMAQTLNDQYPNQSSATRLLGFVFVGLNYLVAGQSMSYRRITGVELTEAIMKRAAVDGWKIYLLGGKPGVAKTAGQILTKRYPNLQIVGTSDTNPNDSETIPNIAHTKPDLLLVAYGAPKQDVFIFTHKKELHIPVMIGVGGTFDYTVGIVKRPPSVMRSIGLEWLGRLLFQPKRIRRIWNATFVFWWLVSKNPK